MQWATAASSSTAVAATAVVESNTEQQQLKSIAGLYKYIRVYSYVAQQCTEYNYNLSGQGILYSHTPRCLTKRHETTNGTPTKRNKALRESNPRPRALRECTLLKILTTRRFPT